MMTVNKEFTKNAIKNLMERNYKVKSDLLDLDSLIDSTLSMPENWVIIKPKVLLLSKNNQNYY